MMTIRKLIFVLIFIIVACSKDVDSSTEVNNKTQETPIQEQNNNSNNQDSNNNQNNQNSNTSTQVPFTSRSERYSAINETTGYFNNQNNFYNYTTDSLARVLHYEKDNCNSYMFSTSDQVTYDFNNDGYLDSVVFQYHSGGCNAPTYGYETGIFAVYNNFFNERTVQYFETDLRWVAGDWELNDINGDGDYEIIVWNFNRHENRDFPLKDISILDIDSNLNLTERQLEFTGYDFHNGSSGDIDNDGDIDLIKWKIGNYDQKNDQYFPKVLLNDGTGNFVEEPLLENQQELESEFYSGWGVTVNDLFDLNNDGFLDLIVGLDFGNFEPITTNYYHFDDYYKDIMILWGNEKGKFNTNDMLFLDDSNYLNIGQTFLGSLFTDYDSDGDIDLITTSTDNDYTRYAINIFQNNGDMTFTDVTESDCTQCYNNGEDFSNFYRFYSVDIDNDGDYDLVPGDVNSWAWDNVNNQFKEYLDNLYWENVGGRFEIRKEN